MEINCFTCSVEANAEHDFFILTSLKNWNKNQRAKQCMHSLRKSDITVATDLFSFGAVCATKILLLFWDTCKRPPSSQYRRPTNPIYDTQRKKIAMKRRWKRNDIKLIFCRYSQQHNKLYRRAMLDKYNQSQRKCKQMKFKDTGHSAMWSTS